MLQSDPEQLTLLNNETVEITRIADSDFWGSSTTFYPDDIKQWINLVEYRICLLSAIHEAIIAMTDASGIGALSSTQSDKKDKILQNLNNFILEEKIIQKPKQRNNATSA